MYSLQRVAVTYCFVHFIMVGPFEWVGSTGPKNKQSVHLNIVDTLG